MLPGVVLFEGNLSLYGRLDNAILATGHIETSSNVELWSLRQAGAARVCRSPDFPDAYPLNHCSVDRNALRESPLLGIALLAGGYDAARPSAAARSSWAPAIASMARCWPETPWTPPAAPISSDRSAPRCKAGRPAVHRPLGR